MAAKGDGYGAALMKKQGWTDGQGIGKNGNGLVDAVKVSKKDDNKGIGYSAKVNQTWSAQSVAFDDVLSRVSGTSLTPPPASGESDSDAGSGPSSPTTRLATASAGKHAVAFAKRRALKTGALTSTEGKQELLAGASKKKLRSEREAEVEGSDDENDVEKAKAASTLRSPILRRISIRCIALEPKATTTAATITVTKPNPKPPKVTDTPFCL
jgi:Pin2-interacting protein X1